MDRTNAEVASDACSVSVSRCIRSTPTYLLTYLLTKLYSAVLAPEVAELSCVCLNDSVDRSCMSSVGSLFQAYTARVTDKKLLPLLLLLNFTNFSRIVKSLQYAT